MRETEVGATWYNSGLTSTSCEGGLESGGKDNTKQTNELLLRALKWALPVLQPIRELEVSF